MPKAEGNPDSLFRQESAESTSSTDEHANPAPDSPIDHVPDSPIETNDVDVHVENENTLSEEEAADTLDRHLSDPVDAEDDDIDDFEPEQADADDRSSTPEEDNIHDGVQTQISFESSNPEEVDLEESDQPEDVESPTEANSQDNSFDQTCAEETKNEDHAPEIPSQDPAHEIVSPAEESAAPNDVADTEPLTKPIETQTVQGPDSKFGCCMDFAKCMMST